MNGKEKDVMNKSTNTLRMDFQTMKKELNYKQQKESDKNETRIIYQGTGKGKML